MKIMNCSSVCFVESILSEAKMSPYYCWDYQLTDELVRDVNDYMSAQLKSVSQACFEKHFTNFTKCYGCNFNMRVLSIILAYSFIDETLAK
jgi:hypothetical protein